MSRADVEVLFDLMDTDNEGELSYNYLIENLRMSQLDDTRKSLTMLRLEVAEIARCCKRVYHVLHTYPTGRISRSTPGLYAN